MTIIHEVDLGWRKRTKAANHICGGTLCRKRHVHVAILVPASKKYECVLRSKLLELGRLLAYLSVANGRSPSRTSLVCAEVGRHSDWRVLLFVCRP